MCAEILCGPLRWYEPRDDDVGGAVNINGTSNNDTDVGRRRRNANTYNVSVAVLPWMGELERYLPALSSYGKASTGSDPTR